MPGRLLDDFRAHLVTVGATLLGEIEVCGMFGDLEWSPHGVRGEDVMVRADRDPAFTISGHSRWLAFACICDEIRYYAGPLLVSGDLWVASDGERRAAIEAEPDVYELGCVFSAADAVSLTLQYLAGIALVSISIPRSGGRRNSGVATKLTR